MEAVDLLRNRIGAVKVGLHNQVGELAGLDWVRPVAPGTSPLGLTLWHFPRAQDWVLNTCVLGAPEVADKPEHASLPDPEVYGFGTGLTPEQAGEAASLVDADALLQYADAVHAQLDGWLAGLSATDLDVPVKDFMERQQTRRSYSTPEALAEVTGLVDLPLGVLVARPAVSHLLMHLGELELLGQLARSSASDA